MIHEVADGVLNLNCKVDEFNGCEICIQAKSTRSSHKKTREKGIGYCKSFVKMCWDHWSSAIKMKKKFVVNFIDDKSNFCFVYTNSNRAEVYDAFDDFLKVTRS